MSIAVIAVKETTKRYAAIETPSALLNSRKENEDVAKMPTRSIKIKSTV
jgi:hypothetical protein